MGHFLTKLAAAAALGAIALVASGCADANAEEDVATDDAAISQALPCTKAPCTERPIIWIHGHAGTALDGDKILRSMTAPGERFDSFRYVGNDDHDWAPRSIPRREWLFSFDYYLEKGSDRPHSYTAGPGRIGSFDKLCPDQDGYKTGHTHEFAADLLSLVDDVLKATGARQVDILAHSMGGLITRSVITFGAGGRDKIKNALLLATPQKGVPGASLQTLFSDNPDWMTWRELTELDRFKLTSKSDFRICGEGGSSKTFTSALTSAELAQPAGPTIHCMKGSKDRFIYDDSARYDRCSSYEELRDVDHSGILQRDEAAAKAREVLGGTYR